VATLPLVAAVVDAVRPVPVIAAGGVADGRGLAAVLVLGADAAWVGTRFLMAQEANVHDEWRGRIRDASETSTVYATVFDGGWPDSPHRALRNSTVDAWERAGRPAAPGRPGERDVVARAPDGACLYRYGAEIPVRGVTGDVEALAHYVGQSAGIVEEVRPAATIVRSWSGVPLRRSRALACGADPRRPPTATPTKAHSAAASNGSWPCAMVTPWRPGPSQAGAGTGWCNAAGHDGAVVASAAGGPAPGLSEEQERGLIALSPSEWPGPGGGLRPGR
jgi:hypothetical protein